MSWSDNFKSKETLKREAMEAEIKAFEAKALELEKDILDPAFLRYGSLQDMKRLKDEHFTAVSKAAKLKRALAKMDGVGK